MAQPYVGEIRMFAGNFAPAGWAFCDGRLLPISENDTLFNLIGTTYGGDGQETFGLPDLRGRLPVHTGTGMTGATGGVESVTLGAQQVPVHNHALSARGGPGSSSSPIGSLPAAGAAPLYVEDAPSQPLSNQSLTPAGGSQPHENRQPFLCISFIVSLFGIYPSQT